MFCVILKALHKKGGTKMSDFKKKYLKMCLIGIGILIVLAVAFMIGGGESETLPNAQPTELATEEPDDTIVFSETHTLAEPTAMATPEPTPEPSATPIPISVNETMHIDAPKDNICTISVNCSNIDRTKLTVEKQKILPQDGIILTETSVEIKDGECVFDVLKRVLTDKKIHFAVNTTPGIGKYVSGIGNLFEKDAGANSGWGFKVNGEFPTVAATELKVNAGDVIEWVYFK